jgi:AAA+ ATPase superfamily predicted ATPase
MVLIVVNFSGTLVNAEMDLDYEYKEVTNETEIDYKLIYDALLTTLDLYITEEIINYYGYPKQYGLSDAKILSVIREIEGGFSFKVKVQVTTFEHAHNPPYGIETITFDISPFGVKVIEFKHEGDEEEKKIKQFYQEVLSDIIQSFNLKLQSYSMYTYDQLFYQSEKQIQYKTLTDIVENIIVNILNPQIKPPYKNVIDPVTFIKKDKGYILFKTDDGTNVVYFVKKENSKWKIIDKKFKKGKVMKKELLWYM